MCLSTYIDLKTFLDGFMTNSEIISLTIGSDVLVLVYRSTESLIDQLPKEIEYCNEHYVKNILTEIKIKTENGYDHTNIYVITYLYNPPMLHIPPTHKYNLTIGDIARAVFDNARHAKELSKVNKDATDRCNTKFIES